MCVLHMRMHRNEIFTKTEVDYVLIRGKTKRAVVRQSLIKFVEDNYSADDTQVGYLFNLCDEYMELLDISAKLRADIKRRGVNYEFINSKDEVIYKKNESIAELNRTVQSMVRIQVQLGIRPQNAVSKGDGHDLL